jgi:hypothetical protein
MAWLNASGDASFTTHLRRTRALYAWRTATPDAPPGSISSEDVLELRTAGWLDVAPAPAPAGVAVAAVTDDSATLAWAPGPPGTEYAVSFRETGTAAWSTLASTATVGATVGGLTPGFPYDFRVAQYGCGCLAPTASPPVSAVLPGAATGYAVALYEAGAIASFSSLSVNYDYTGWPAPTLTGIASATPLLGASTLSSAHVATQGGNFHLFAERVTASFVAPSTGTYGFALTVADGGALYVDDDLLIGPGAWQDQFFSTLFTASVPLSAGVHALDARYYQDVGPATFALDWQPPGATAWSSLNGVVFQSTAGPT